MIADPKSENLLFTINRLDEQLLRHFNDVLVVNNKLDRTLVSFQANKTEAFYRWYKYKEAFSSRLVKFLLQDYQVQRGIVFDPFAGIGTTLFAASELGYNTEGIELLPIGIELIENKIHGVNKAQTSEISRLKYWQKNQPWQQSKGLDDLTFLKITKGAYPKETEIQVRQYLYTIKRESEVVQKILLTALLSILESVSFTRKDGQYLRWDYRSGRQIKSRPFDKGKIYNFQEAITIKLEEIINDLQGDEKQLSLFNDNLIKSGDIKLYQGSCLNILPKIEANQYTAIITSPPYCNRYDYTRTYALELALLGVDEEKLRHLRQELLSCTVENKEKALLEINKDWKKAIKICDNEQLFQTILSYLYYQKEIKKLNNNGILRMVKGYFYEMSCVIQESFRILKDDGFLFMVNDNVRYAGASIPVDLILSKIAENLGFMIEKILVLPNGKGNSSQQMGTHGRKPLRKCVYVWRKK
ncbi:DNA methyltransferase [Cyanothece sp. BG0011]|uniref:DNA methyltransferase n=1 Tax=Cyanothece sp. BG0011 TaxID=2082950 RepID=UPI000D1E561A|nr:DNA methyltransferase [Cyanothece sp. BG0011]